MCFCFPLDWAEIKRNERAVQRGAGGNGDPNPSGNAPWLGAGAAVSAGDGMWLLVQSCASSASVLNAKGGVWMPRDGTAPLASHPEPFVPVIGSERSLPPLQSLWFTGRAH